MCSPNCNLLEVLIHFICLIKQGTSQNFRRNSVSIWQMNALYPSPPKNVAYNFGIVYQNRDFFLGKLSTVLLAAMSS